MGRPVHFEFATPDPELEIAYFSTLLGWEIGRWGEEEYWLADTGKEPMGINGAIMRLSAPDQPRVVTTMGVESIDDAIAKAVELGGTIAMEKQEVPGIGWTAYIVSPTGILFGMIEPMPML